MHIILIRCTYAYLYETVPFSGRDSEECDIWNYFIKGDIVGYVSIYFVVRAVLI